MAEKVHLSDIDKRILKHLILNGAQFSEYEIAKKLRLSQTTVHYNIRKMEKNGVITGYRTTLNPFKVGYNMMSWFFIDVGRQVDMDDLTQQLLQHKSIFDVLVMAGDTDIVIKAYFKTEKELKQLIYWIGNSFQAVVQNLSIIIVIDVHKLHQSVIEDQEPAELSKKEKDFLKHLVADPKMKISEIAKKMKIHRNTAASYWKKLWKENVILKKSVIISPLYFSDMEIDFKAIILIDTTIGKNEEVVEQIKNMDEIHELTCITSKNNVLAIVKIKDLFTCYRFVRKLYKTKDILSTRTLPVFMSKVKSVKI